jgi:hypothetical protein
MDGVGGHRPQKVGVPLRYQAESVGAYVCGVVGGGGNTRGWFLTHKFCGDMCKMLHTTQPQTGISKCERVIMVTKNN